MRGSSSIFSFKAAKAALFAALAVAFCVYTGRAYSEAAEKNLVNRWNGQRFEDFYNTPKNTLDMVFIGSSHSYCTFDPLLIDSALGVNSFQMGMPLQMADATYYTLREILNYQRPKTVVMEVYWRLIDKSFDLKQAEALFKVLRNGALRQEYINGGFPVSERVKFHLPFIRFQQDFFMYQNSGLLKYLETEYGLKQEAEQQEGTEYYSDKGFMHCDYNMTPSKYAGGNQFNGFDGKAWSIDKNQKKYLDMIVELCEKENIRLIFVTAPVANVSMEKMKNYDLVHEAVAAYSAENGVPYFDFNMINMEERLFTNENFRDDAHLNYSGAVIACEYFAGAVGGME